MDPMEPNMPPAPTTPTMTPPPPGPEPLPPAPSPMTAPTPTPPPPLMPTSAPASGSKIMTIVIVVIVLGAIWYGWQWFAVRSAIPGATVVSPGKVIVNTPEGQATYEAGGAITDTSGIQVYPGAKVTAKVSSGSAQGQATIYSLTTGDSIDQVTTYYKNYYLGQGWTLASEMNSAQTGGQFSVLAFKQGNLVHNFQMTRDTASNQTLITESVGSTNQ